MSEGAVHKPIVLVTGDISLTWDLIHKTGDGDHRNGYVPENQFSVYRQSCGAWHMTNILRIFAAELGWEVVGVGPKEGAPVLGDYARLSHAYATWTEFPLSAAHPKEKAVRVATYVGSEPRTQEPQEAWFNDVADADAERVGLVVASDDGIEVHDGTRGYAANRRNLLPRVRSLLSVGRAPWILWKDRGVREDRGVFSALSGGRQHEPTSPEERAVYDRTIAVLGVDVLRRGVRRVGNRLSWDSVAEAARDAVIGHVQLGKCRWVLVSFSNAGVLLVDRDPAGWKSWLVFDPGGVEGSWTSAHEGRMVGSTTCLMAAVARKVMEAGADRLVKDRLVEAIQDGLLRMRILHYAGYDVATKDPAPPVTGTHDAQNPTTGYATPAIAELAKKLATRYPDLQKAVGQAGSFIEVAQPPAGKTMLEMIVTDVDGLALKIAKMGPKAALKGAPRLEYGGLVTTDPREIDALQTIATLLRNYAEGTDPKPLSVAVFGQPGSGKSFGIKQIARQLGGRVSDRELTFNLSQLSQPSMLVDALHQVRDVVLSGKIPLVFWDEFDTTLGSVEFGWLRYFLAPMQDGEFLDGQITHSIGRAIFVFAGGTSHKMSKFFPGERRTDDELKAAKVPDFVSRLRGTLDVQGINEVREGKVSRVKAAKAAKEEVIPPGAHLKVRRAIILHSHLKKLPGIADGDEIRVSEAVARALVQILEYKHGARSLEAIVRMSALEGARDFTVSCLPGEAQLDLHVDGKELLKLAGAT